MDLKMGVSSFFQKGKTQATWVERLDRLKEKHNLLEQGAVKLPDKANQ